MSLAIRPVLMAGIAFAGAGVIATAPFTPSLPDVQIPSITTPALELAALPSYFEWVQATTDALTYQLPTLQQIIESGIDGLLPVVEQLFDHQLPDVSSLINNLVETGTLPSSSALQEAMKAIVAAQGTTDGATLIPAMVDGLVAVVQDIASFASRAVEPVITYLLKATIATITRLSQTLKATFTDIPQIAVTLVAAAGSVVGTFIDNVQVVIEAATTLDAAAILKAATEGLANVQHAIGEQAGAVLEAIDQYRIDVEKALALPEWLPMPPKSPGSAASTSDQPVAASVAEAAPAERKASSPTGTGTPNPAAGVNGPAAPGNDATLEGNTPPSTLSEAAPDTADLPSAPSSDNSTTDSSNPDSNKPDDAPVAKAPSGKAPHTGTHKGGSKRPSTKPGSTD